VVSEPIYKFFQALYDEETKRFAELESRARLYFSIASLYVGAISFKFDDVVRLVARVNLSPVLIVVDEALFIVAVLFCVLAMQVRKYERIADPDELLDEFEAEDDLFDEQFFEDRIIDYSVATQRNAAANNRVALRLAVSAFSILAGVAGQILLFVYVAVQQIRG